MDDEHLDRVINTLRDSYRVAPEPPLNEMWREIDAELDARASGVVPLAPSRTNWRVAGMAAAAALVFGVGVGRMTAPSAGAGGGAAVASANADGVQQVQLELPLQRTATNYLGETALLLRQVQSDSPGAYSAHAGTLLATTRRLLDSPVASDPRLLQLLEDLELLLAQLATMQGNGNGARSQEHLQMIRTALTERDVMPRVHTAAATFASFDD